MEKPSPSEQKLPLWAHVGLSVQSSYQHLFSSGGDGASLGLKPGEEEKISGFSILSYIRMTTSIILASLFFCTRRYLLMKTKRMYLTLIAFLSQFGFCHSWRGGRSQSGGRRRCWNVRVEVCHKDIIALEDGHLLPFRSHVCERVCERECVDISGSLIPFLVLLKSVLIFHRWGFYGTDSIHEILTDTILFFKRRTAANEEDKHYVRTGRPSLRRMLDGQKLRRWCHTFTAVIGPPFWPISVEPYQVLSHPSVGESIRQALP